MGRFLAAIIHPFTSKIKLATSFKIISLDKTGKKRYYIFKAEIEVVGLL